MTAITLPATRLAALLSPIRLERPAYRALAEQLRLLIVDGRVIVGTRLPSERDLMAALGVSRTTVTAAYGALREAGYAVARQGSGTVAALPNGTIRRGTGLSLFPADRTGSDATDGTDSGEVIDLTCAATRAPSGLAQAYAVALEQMPGYLAGAGYFTLGLPELREVIAARYTERGLPTSPEEILVTSGAVAGMAIAHRAFVRPGARVLVENPGYPNTVDSLRRMGARLTAVPVDSSGWDTSLVVGSIRAHDPAVAVLVPDFHNPTGAYLPDDQRAEIGHALRRAGTVTLIDETIAEMALDEGPAALPFAAHLPEAVLIGSASKSHWGGLRLGWIRARTQLQGALLDARVTIDLGAPVLEQLALLELMRHSPGLAPARRQELVTARDQVAAALRTQLPDLDFTTPGGGLCLWLHLGATASGPAGSASALVEAAEQAGLLLASGNRFAAVGSLDRWLRLPYVLPVEQLEEAVRRLAQAQAHVTAGARTRGERTAYGKAGRRTATRRPLVA